MLCVGVVKLSGTSEDERTSTERRYKALLDVTEAIVLNEDVGSLSQEVARRLARILGCDLVVFFLHDPENGALRLTQVGTNTGESVPFPKVMPADETPSGRVWRSQEPLLYNDISQQIAFPRIFNLLQARGLRTYWLLPLSTSRRKLGALAFASQRTAAFDKSDLHFFQCISEQVAVVVESGINRERAKAYREELTAERDRLRVLLELSNVLVTGFTTKDLLPAISSCLKRIIAHDHISLCLLEHTTGNLHLHSLTSVVHKEPTLEELTLSMKDVPHDWLVKQRKPVLLDPLAAPKYRVEIVRRMITSGIQSACLLPLTTAKTTVGMLCLGSFTRNVFREADVEFLERVANQTAIALENVMAYRQIEELKDKLAAEKSYLEKEIESEYPADEIVGESPELKHALRQARTVAQTGSTVLILGETGTGKELIARRIHFLSPRKDRSFIKVNCAAIPTGLLESELFGHEKGAFTGAISRKIGRLELAHQGTLFLDEVGDIPLELQPKLLRVLQEHEFERLGSTRTQKVDVRVIAATNRNLEEMVAQGRFRMDLYYRLKVFPIVSPPLRDRREDVAMLVRYFVQKLARKMNRHIESIPEESLTTLKQWHWPGNVRELENLIERAVILSSGPALEVPLVELETINTKGSPETLDEAEREHIIRVLRESGGVIGGPEGAAARLGLRRTTLHFKMKKLGITRQDL